MRRKGCHGLGGPPLQPSHIRAVLASRIQSGGVLGCFIIGLLGCNDLTGSQPLPSGTENPSFYSTPAGALGMRTAALASLQTVIPQFLIDAGLLTDELETNAIGADAFDVGNSLLASSDVLDQRVIPELPYEVGSSPADLVYDSLQAVRGEVNQAVGALVTYDTGAIQQGDPVVMRAELYALQAYAEILLSDLFCSGVPLSTLDFQKDYTLHASSTTTQVYQDALAKLDSAIALSDTSTRILNLARVLQGRALLDLDSVTAAARAVAAVPNGFQYQLAIQWSAANGQNFLVGEATIADREGGNGIPFLSAGDPRTTVETLIDVGQSAYGTPFVPLTFPTKYATTGFSPFPVADWIEARLIQAEATLRAANPALFITQLNQLRATASVPGQLVPVPATLKDPGTDSARVALLFQERAYWLFLTGHRQGDLRRLLRQFGQWFRHQDQVYPAGPYDGPERGTYGTDVTAPIPGAEYANPLFKGCLTRDP